MNILLLVIIFTTIIIIILHCKISFLLCLLLSLLTLFMKCSVSRAGPGGLGSHCGPGPVCNAADQAILSKTLR